MMGPNPLATPSAPNHPLGVQYPEAGFARLAP